jgi:hypothetical protein
MGTLLLDRDLHGATEDSDVRRLARARTLVVLDALGPDRQNKVFRFLSETELIQAGTGIGHRSSASSTRACAASSSGASTSWRTRTLHRPSCMARTSARPTWKWQT